MNRTDRLYALVEELRAAAPRARPARQLAARFEVSARTIERDLLALQEAGVPIWATPGPGGGYSIDPALTLPSVNFTASEATALAVAVSLSGDTPFADAARAALRKLMAAMTYGGAQDAKELADRIRLMASRAGPKGPVLRAVERAVVQRRVVELDYQDRHGQATVRQVEAYGLVGNPDGRWYLVGWCRLRAGGRVFRLDRIGAARVSGEAAPERSWAEVASQTPATLRAAALLE